MSSSSHGKEPTNVLVIPTTNASKKMKL